MAKEVNVLALVKGDEQYLFLFDDSNRVETLRLLGRYAADPDLSFSWYDAAVLSQKIRSTMSAATLSSSSAVSSSNPTAANSASGNPSSAAGSSHPSNSARSKKPASDSTPVRFQFPSFKEERLPE